MKRSGVLLGVDPEKLVTRADYASAVKKLAKRATRLSLPVTMTGKAKILGLKPRPLPRKLQMFRLQGHVFSPFSKRGKESL